MLELYKNIKKRRLELELTQTELANKMGYADKSMIAKIEKGLVDLTQSKILAFAEVLEIEPSDLMGWEEPKQYNHLFGILKNIDGGNNVALEDFDSEDSYIFEEFRNNFKKTSSKIGYIEILSLINNYLSNLLLVSNETPKPNLELSNVKTQQIIYLMSQLNDEGLKKVAEHIEILTKINDYIK